MTKETKSKEEMHLDICKKLHETYVNKNSDYGDSFTKVRDKYPNSILIRLNDKMNRLETLMTKNDQKVKDESIDDTLLDIANYAILELIERNYKQNFENSIHDISECFNPFGSVSYIDAVPDDRDLNLDLNFNCEFEFEIDENVLKNIKDICDISDEMKDYTKWRKTSDELPKEGDVVVVNVGKAKFDICVFTDNTFCSLVLTKFGFSNYDHDKIDCWIKVPDREWRSTECNNKRAVKKDLHFWKCACAKVDNFKSCVVYVHDKTFGSNTMDIAFRNQNGKWISELRDLGKRVKNVEYFFELPDIRNKHYESHKN